ncbi:hypothetical protein ACFFRR_001753 [Megaselia abdita]
MKMDEEMQKKMKAFNNLLNQDAEIDLKRELEETKHFKDRLIKFREESQNNNFEENEKEENYIDKANYLMEEISKISRKVALQEENVQKLQQLKATLEIELNEKIVLTKTEGVNNFDDEHLFDISMVVEGIGINLYLVKILFSENKSVTFQYNSEKNTFDLQETSPKLDNFEVFKKMALLTNDIGGFLYIFRREFVEQ